MTKLIAVLLLALTLLSCTAKHNKIISGPEPVLVATANIPNGTPGDWMISRHLVQVVEILRGTAKPEALTSEDELHGYVSIDAIPKGAEITTELLAEKTAVIPTHGPPR